MKKNRTIGRFLLRAFAVLTVPLAVVMLLSMLQPGTPLNAGKQTPPPGLKKAGDPLTVAADRILKRMSLRQKIGQMLMIGLVGKTLTPHDRANIAKYKPAGFIIMSYNNKENWRLQRLTRNLRALCLRYGGVPPLLASDKEGGYFTSIIRGLTIFPPNYALGMINDTNLTAATATITGMELRRLGINMNLAPVLDVHSNPTNPIINTRSYSSNAVLVARHARSYVAGMNRAGMITTGKHFPGHGATETDSHKLLPVVKCQRSVLLKRDLYPFARTAASGIPVIMTSHIHYPALDPVKESASLSYKILTGILRKKFKYNGVIMTDDLNMDAIDRRMKVPEAALRSVQAGADLLLTIACHKRLTGIYWTLYRAVKSGKLRMKRIDDSVRRILRMKLQYGLINPAADNLKIPPYRPLPFKADRSVLTLLSNRQKLNRRISAEALYLQTNNNKITNRKAENWYWLNNGRFQRFQHTKKVRILSTRWISYNLRRRGKNSRPVRLWFSQKKLAPWQVRQLRRWKKAYPALQLIRVVIGNPFLIKPLPCLDGTLYTFSRTSVSLRAAAALISGATHLTQHNLDPQGLHYIRSKQR